MADLDTQAIQDGHRSASARHAWPGGEMVYDQTVLAGPSPQWFDPANAALGAQPVSAGGRAAAWYVSIHAVAAVLRRYRRGGLVARVVRDRYVWQGLSRARAFAEFDLMRTLWLAGLPVPRPLAAAVWRGRFTYRAAILTARIAGATPLSQANRPEIWSNAGRVIAEMHRLGAWHADLNVFNILIDDQAQVWLIDFDRGHLGHLTDAQRADNLSRLLRSVRKVVPELESSCWASLNKAYHARWHDSEKAL